MIFNESLTPTQINELYNSGAGYFYPFSVAGYQTSLNISSPDNNSIIQVSNFTTDFNFTIESTTLFYNATLNIYNSAGSLVGSMTRDYNTNKGNFSDTLFYVMSNAGRFSFNITAEYNDSDGSVGVVSSETRQFINGAIFNVIDENGDLVTDAITEVGDTIFNSNPFSYSASLMTNPTNENLSIYSYSEGGFFQSNTTTIIVNLSKDYEYNISLESYRINLLFTQEGSPFNVSGYITDNITSITFQNESFLKQQVDFSGTIVQARFINGIYNISGGS